MKKQKPYNVVSLFDGCSIARLALDEAKIPVGKYYASEIDPYAIAITQKNFPDTIQIGSVLNVAGDKKSTKQQYLFSHTKTAIRSYYTGGIDLLIGGSPCQDLSIAKKDRKGLDGERSGLFWEYVRIWNELKPRYFILENVASMPKEAKDEITRELGVEPIMIDASLVSAQNRKRLFWTNIPNVKLPEDRGILLKDVLDTDENIAYEHRNRKDERWRKNASGKVPTLRSVMGTGGDNVPYIVQRARGKNKGGVHEEKCPTITSSSFVHNNHVVRAKAKTIRVGGGRIATIQQTKLGRGHCRWQVPPQVDHGRTRATAGTARGVHKRGLRDAETKDYR